MKKLLFLGACLVTLASAPVKAQTSEPEVTIVRLVEIPGRAKMVIVRPGGKTEDYSFDAGLTTASLREGGLTIQRVITSLVREGYTLKSTVSGAAGASTLVFMKEK